MTELRAMELDPSLTTGIAVSTTLVTGDCRPHEDVEPMFDACGNLVEIDCAHERTPMLVLAIPINTSVPSAPECDGAFLVEELRRLAVFEARASEDGELVGDLPEGRYTLYVSTDDHCAYCGLEEIEAACVIDVSLGEIAVRDLVLDRSTR